jgi:hypothetical protein
MRQGLEPSVNTMDAMIAETPMLLEECVKTPVTHSLINDIILTIKNL